MRRAVALLCTLLFCASCSEPPQKEIDRAQGALDAARAAGAEQYAAAEFGDATSALQQAHEAVGQRDYRLALSRALDASQRAQDAARQAADGRARARSEAESAVQASTTAIQELEARLKAAGRPADAELKPARQALLQAQRMVQEASTAIASGKYLEASAAVKDTASGIAAQIADLEESSSSRTAKKRR